MPYITVNGISLATDEEGYLSNLQDWNEDVPKVMAQQDDIELTEAHWELINFLREYYEEYQVSPNVRVLAKVVGKKFGLQKGTSKYLYSLFPYGPSKQGNRYAGLPKAEGEV